MRDSTFSTAAVLFLSILLIVGCGRTTGSPASDSGSITDSTYLTADVWNDGKSEVAFYRVERTRDQYGQPNRQEFLVGTYLVKHRFSPAEMTKMTDGTGVSSFKYALFYELESGSYQYKRSWVVNARQDDLRPFKQSFASFDWCSNLYRELAYPETGPVEVLKRSDDYGNREGTIERRSGAYPPAQIPLLVRALDVGARDTLDFAVTVADSNAHTSAHALYQGEDSVETEAGSFLADRVTIRYESPVPSPIGERSASAETYWIGTGPQRRLLRVEAESGRYEMTLVEHLRTAYWEENFWPLLSRVEERP